MKIHSDFGRDKTNRIPLSGGTGTGSSLVESCTWFLSKRRPDTNKPKETTKIVSVVSHLLLVLRPYCENKKWTKNLGRELSGPSSI